MSERTRSPWDKQKEPSPWVKSKAEEKDPEEGGEGLCPENEEDVDEDGESEEDEDDEDFDEGGEGKSDSFDELEDVTTGIGGDEHPDYVPWVVTKRPEDPLPAKKPLSASKKPRRNKPKPLKKEMEYDRFNSPFARWSEDEE